MMLHGNQHSKSSLTNCQWTKLHILQNLPSYNSAQKKRGINKKKTNINFTTASVLDENYNSPCDFPDGMTANGTKLQGKREDYHGLRQLLDNWNLL